MNSKGSLSFRRGRFSERWRNANASLSSSQNVRTGYAAQRTADWRQVSRNMDVVNKKMWDVFTLRDVSPNEMATLFRHYHSLLGKLFAPMCIRCVAHESMVVFTIVDRSVADTVFPRGGILKLDNGKKIRVKRTMIKPRCQLLDGVQKELVKQVLSKRYDAITKQLNLRDFQNDPAFLEFNVVFPLTRMNVVIAVVDILKQNTSEILAVDLSHNMLTVVDVAASLMSILSAVTKLILDDNKISHTDEFYKVNFWNLQEISLRNNPIRDNLTDRQLFTKLRSIFANFSLLDGRPEASYLEVPTAGSLTMQGSYLVNDTVGSMMSAFLRNYFNVYDSDNLEDRNKLLEAYHANRSVFTLCMENVADQKHRIPLIKSWRKLIRRSHNILFHEIWKNRTETLEMCGSMSITCFLKDAIPDTKHDLDSILLDVNVINNSQALCMMSGFFKDPTDSSGFLLHFHKALILESVDNRMTILNETLYVSPSTEDIFAEYKQHLVMIDGRNQQRQMAAANATLPVAPSNEALLQQQMVVQFSAMTGMKSEWSEKCLSENAWQFDKAYEIFVTLNANGRVPVEAFAAQH